MSTAVITGAPSGIGFDFTKKLIQRGTYDKIIIAARNDARGEETIKRLRDETGSAGSKTKLVAYPCEMASLASVRSFASQVQGGIQKIDLLVLNAGVAAGDGVDMTTKASEDGIEMTFAVNHVAHWYIFQLLLPQLRAAGKARVVITASKGHFNAKVPNGWRTIATTGSGSYLQAYLDSKLANVMHANEIQRRFASAGITANSLHPGAIRETGIWRDQTKSMSMFMGIMGTVDEGSDALLMTCDEKEGGKYLDIKDWIPCSPLAKDEGLAKELWDFTDSLIKEKLGEGSRL